MPSKKAGTRLRAISFAVSTLFAVHLGIYVWLSYFVYGSSIRGYVPASLSGLAHFSLAAVIMFLYLCLLARRHRSCSYVAIGTLAPPIALIAASVYSSTRLSFLGYSFKADMIVSCLGATLSAFAALIFLPSMRTERTELTHTKSTDAAQCDTNENANELSNREHR